MRERGGDEIEFCLSYRRGLLTACFPPPILSPFLSLVLVWFPLAWYRFLSRPETGDFLHVFPITVLRGIPRGWGRIESFVLWS